MEVKNLKGKITWKTRVQMEDNIKMDLWKIQWGCGLQITQDRGHWLVWVQCNESSGCIKDRKLKKFQLLYIAHSTKWSKTKMFYHHCFNKCHSVFLIFWCDYCTSVVKEHQCIRVWTLVHTQIHYNSKTQNSAVDHISVVSCLIVIHKIQV